MTTEEKRHIRDEALSEAKRYRQNAKDALKNTGIDNVSNMYTDRKYVKTAYGILYSGFLLVTDAYIAIKGKALPKRKSIEFYRTTLKDDRRMLDMLNMFYDQAHLSGYYDGNPSVGSWKATVETYDKFTAYFKIVTE